MCRWAQPVRILVPISFNAYRMPLLEQWREFVFSPENAMSISSVTEFGALDKFFCFLTGATHCYAPIQVPNVYPRVQSFLQSRTNEAL
jgi:hypothetical protein